MRLRLWLRLRHGGGQHLRRRLQLGRSLGFRLRWRHGRKLFQLGGRIGIAAGVAGHTGSRSRASLATEQLVIGIIVAALVIQLVTGVDYTDRRARRSWRRHGDSSWRGKCFRAAVAIFVGFDAAGAARRRIANNGAKHIAQHPGGGLVHLRDQLTCRMRLVRIFRAGREVRCCLLSVLRLRLRVGLWMVLRMLWLGRVTRALATLRRLTLPRR